MTGEVMRFSVTAMATNGRLPTVEALENEGDTPPQEKNVLNDMRSLRSALEFFNPGTGPFAKDVEQKM